MNELIPINFGGDTPMVSGRDLHTFLGVKTAYRDWFPRQCEYGFVEGIDFRSFLSESTGGRPATEHELTIDMAKEVSMVQRTAKGKQARQYFIAVEKAWNTPEAIMARALQIANQTVGRLQTENAGLVQTVEEQAQVIEEQAPKVVFADAVADSDDTILVRDLAKILKSNGLEDIGQNRLFELLRTGGFLISHKPSSSYNTPTQLAMELGLFKIKETVITHTDGRQSLSFTTKVTGKGQTYFVNYFLNRKNAKTSC